MTKLQTCIMQADFKKFFKMFFIISLILVIAGSVAVGISFRQQIAETVQYARINEHVGGLENAFITEPTLSAVIILAVFACVCCVIFAVYWLSVAACLYQTAIFSGMHGFLWFILGICGNIFAAVLFIFARSILRKQCAVCGSWQSTTSRFCTDCGAELFAKCPICGASRERGEQYCSSCGTALKERET